LAEPSKTVSFGYDAGGNRNSIVKPGSAATATYSDDLRDRCTQIQKDGSVLADYTWLSRLVRNERRKRVTLSGSD